MIVITRYRRDVSMMPATCASQALVVVVVAPFASLGVGHAASDWGCSSPSAYFQMGARPRAPHGRRAPAAARRGGAAVAARGRARAALGLARLLRAPDHGDARRRRGRDGRGRRAGDGERRQRAGRPSGAPSPQPTPADGRPAAAAARVPRRASRGRAQRARADGRGRLDRERPARLPRQRGPLGGEAVRGARAHRGVAQRAGGVLELLRSTARPARTGCTERRAPCDRRARVARLSSRAS